MAKKSKQRDTAGSGDARDEAPEFTPAEQRDYVVACVRKQAGVSGDEAENRVQKLKPAQIEKIAQAGRAGDVAGVREQLGLA